MKEFITPKYTFSPGTSGSGYVNLHGIQDFDIKRLVAIINQTKGILIYSTSSETNKYTSVDGTKVYLNFDTSSQSASDELQIIYNLESSTMDLVVMLNNLLSIIASPGIRDKTVNADRATIVNTVTTSPNGGTVSTLTNLTQFGTYQAQMQIIQNNLNAWSNVCRAKIS